MGRRNIRLNKNPKPDSETAIAPKAQQQLTKINIVVNQADLTFTVQTFRFPKREIPKTGGCCKMSGSQGTAKA
jgi:hypothetical protein